MDHPNIVKLYEVFDNAKSTHLILEYLPNGTLFQNITENPKPSINDIKNIMKVIFNNTKYYTYIHCYKDIL